MEVYHTDYIVEIYNGINFIHQLDVFETMEEAEYYMNLYKESEMLLDGEYLNLTIVNYDNEWNEIELHTY